jgi:hypothetical protein
MTLDDFRKSLTATEPSAELTLALVGLCRIVTRGRSKVPNLDYEYL